MSPLLGWLCIEYLVKHPSPILPPKKNQQPIISRFPRLRISSTQTTARGRRCAACRRTALGFPVRFRRQKRHKSTKTMPQFCDMFHTRNTSGKLGRRITFRRHCRRRQSRALHLYDFDVSLHRHDAHYPSIPTPAASPDFTTTDARTFSQLSIAQLRNV